MPVEILKRPTIARVRGVIARYFGKTFKINALHLFLLPPMKPDFS